MPRRPNPRDIKLEDCWAAYAAAAIPEHAPQLQRQAMYQAFLAGADTSGQYYAALERHAPSAVKPAMRAWTENIEGELRRLAEETTQ